MDKKFKQSLPLLQLMWLVLMMNFALPLAAQPVPPTEVEFVTIDYPPLLGKKDSIMTDITTAAFNAMGIAVTYKVYPLARVVRAVTSNSVVGALGSNSWFHYAPADEPVAFIRMYSLNMLLFYLKSRFPEGLKYQDLSELKDYQIGYIRGGSLIPVFEREGIKPDLVRNLSQNVHKVYAGRDDMFAATELGGWAIIERYYPEHVDKFSSAEQAILNISGDIIFASQQRYLAALFQQGFEAIKANGEYLTIIQKYYGGRALPQHMLDFMQQPIILETLKAVE
ncbi:MULTISPECIES: substrate-binding periplasmic protein [unclassified Agarivorans]|uniref:substrate-binding periplasmic protein n=1 Tax=unclassified Agarivorans TaxID=2636026 RepID=UPI003D7DFC5A